MASRFRGPRLCAALMARTAPHGPLVFLGLYRQASEVERLVEVEAIHGAAILLRNPDGVKVRTAYRKADGSYRIGAAVAGHSCLCPNCARRAGGTRRRHSSGAATSTPMMA